MGKKVAIPASPAPLLSIRQRVRKERSLQQARPLLLDKEELRCSKHTERSTEFFCTNPDCLAELCAYCMLEHKEHIDEIKGLGEVAQHAIAISQDVQIDRLQRGLWAGQRQGLRELEALADNIKNLLHIHINDLKRRLILEDEKISSYLQNFDEVQQHFLHQNLSEVRVDSKSLGCLKTLLRYRRKHRFSCFAVEESLLEQQFRHLLCNYVMISPQGACINSTARDAPKYLHWFDWGKRDLNLFDVVSYTRRTVRLTSYFKIPCFSRSTIVPDGRIFLLGGEDPEHTPKRDCYVFNLAALPSDCALHSVAPMSTKKYDFAICYHLGYIYAICGKGVNSEILSSCERYNIELDSWATVADVSRRRYAAAVVAAKEVDRLYLFGGRSENNHQMIDEIEEYSISADCWKMIVLRNAGVFIPVEVCAAAQIGVGRILIFGGSDSSVRDTSATYVFHYGEYRVEKVGALRKPHVFVNAAFIQGDHVFAIGNEYYVKTRNVHRFNIPTCEWDLVF